MPHITDTQAIAYIAKLADLQEDPGCEKSSITAGPFTMFAIIAALQLATRHPEMSDTQRSLLTEIIDQGKIIFAGTPAEDILAIGAMGTDTNLMPVAEEAIGGTDLRAEITDSDNTTITVEVKNPIIRPGHEIRLQVEDQGITWLSAGAADKLARALSSRAAEVRRRDAIDTENEQAYEKATRWLDQAASADPLALNRVSDLIAESAETEEN